MPYLSGANTITDLMKFFGTKENPITVAEFSEFWKSLTEEEREEYKKTLLED